jgi:cytoskeletal protein RodZ
MLNVGAFLKEVRESKEISLEKAAAHTKISILHLKAIEENNWESLPASPYVKGFLRIYATYLGLDPARIIEQYETELKEKKALPPPAPKKKDWPKGLFWFVVLLLVSVSIILWYWYSEKKTQKLTSKNSSALTSTFSKEKTSTSPKEKTPLLFTLKPAYKKETSPQVFLPSPLTKQGLQLQHIVVCLGIKDHNPVVATAT